MRIVVAKIMLIALAVWSNGCGPKCDGFPKHKTFSLSENEKAMLSSNGTETIVFIKNNEDTLYFVGEGKVTERFVENVNQDMDCGYLGEWDMEKISITYRDTISNEKLSIVLSHIGDGGDFPSLGLIVNDIDKILYNINEPWYDEITVRDQTFYDAFGTPGEFYYTKNDGVILFYRDGNIYQKIN